MHRWIRIAIACYLALLTLFASTRFASATFWGNSWPWSSPNQVTLPILYVDQTGSDHNFSNDVYNAAFEWDTTNSPADYLSKDPTGAAEGSVVVNLVQSLPNNWDGATYISGQNVPGVPSNCSSPCSGSGNYTGVTVSMKQPTMDQYSDDLRVHLIAHELGHGLGLGHADGSGNSSIMYHDVNTPGDTSSPTGYDVCNLNTLYPNSLNRC